MKMIECAAIQQAKRPAVRLANAQCTEEAAAQGAFDFTEQTMARVRLNNNWDAAPSVFLRMAKLVMKHAYTRD